MATKTATRLTYYLASGVPASINYPEWLAELIRQHECGIAIALDDQVARADAPEHAADNRMQLVGLGGSLELAKTHFDPALLAKHVVSWLESAAGVVPSTIGLIQRFDA